MASQDFYSPGFSKPAQPQTELSCLLATFYDDGNFTGQFLAEYIAMEKHQNPKFNINEKDDLELTALHWAVNLRNIKAVKILVNYGASVHAKDILGFTPLFYCAGQCPNVHICRYLVEKCHAKYDEVNKNGGTCLHAAAFKGNTEIVKLLLVYGANPRGCNEDGTTPLDLARDHKDVLKLLHQANSKIDSVRDKQEQECATCGASKGLKRCSRCQVTMYCSRECQRKHWKEGDHKSECEEGVIAEPSRHSGYQVTVMHVLGAQKPTVALYGGEVTEYQQSKMTPAQRFVVKVQLPLAPFFGQDPSMQFMGNDLMVYNVDRSVDLFIRAEAPGYAKIVKKIRKEGVWGLKGYFWAECAVGKNNAIKVYPGKLAPVQEW